jgi:hypothetical protein
MAKMEAIIFLKLSPFILEKKQAINRRDLLKANSSRDMGIKGLKIVF